jgi:hypothetical protein
VRTNVATTPARMADGVPRDENVHPGQGQRREGAQDCSRWLLGRQGRGITPPRQSRAQMRNYFSGS